MTTYSVTSGIDVDVVLVCNTCDEIIAEYDAASLTQLVADAREHDREHDGSKL